MKNKIILLLVLLFPGLCFGENSNNQILLEQAGDPYAEVNVSDIGKFGGIRIDPNEDVSID